jgi:hypothetical protein
MKPLDGGGDVAKALNRIQYRTPHRQFALGQVRRHTVRHKAQQSLNILDSLTKPGQLLRQRWRMIRRLCAPWMCWVGTERQASAVVDDLINSSSRQAKIASCFFAALRALVRGNDAPVALDFGFVDLSPRSPAWTGLQRLARGVMICLSATSSPAIDATPTLRPGPNPMFRTSLADPSAYDCSALSA